MKERRIEMTCPYCGHVFHIKVDTLAIAGISQNIEKRLKDGGHFIHQCQNCQKLFWMQYPFLFRDPKRKFILVLSNQESIDNLPEDEKIIRCRDSKQLTFCYQVLSRGLDLPTMIEYKNRWEAKWPSARFVDYDSNNHCLWIEVFNEMKAILLSDMDEKKLIKVYNGENKEGF